MEFNFVNARNYPIRGHAVPVEADEVAVFKANIRLGRITVARILEQAGLEQGDVLYLDIDCDPKQKVLRLTPLEDGEGYRFRTQSSRSQNRSRELYYGAFPAYLKRLGMPMGVYEVIPEYVEQNVFRFKETVAHPSIVANGEIEVGDTVAWVIPADNKREEYLAEGRVMAFKDEKTVQLLVESDEYKQQHPGNFKVTVPVSALTLVKKAGA